MDMTRPPDLHIEIDSIESEDQGAHDLGAVEASVARRLEGTTDAAAAVAAAIAGSIGEELNR
jgi:hypothetical protein